MLCVSPFILFSQMISFYSFYGCQQISRKLPSLRLLFAYHPQLSLHLSSRYQSQDQSGCQFPSGSNTATNFCNLRFSALARRLDTTGSRKLFDEMPQRDLTTYATMINLHIKKGELVLAEKLFNEIPGRNVVLDSAMVDGYVKAGCIDKARKLFDDMPVRNVFSWTSMVSGYCRIGCVEEARRLFDSMPVRNVVSWTTMVLGYARNGFIKKARELFDRMPEKNVVSWTAMITAYVEMGIIDEARALFDVMPHRNLYSWNIMIRAYLDCEDVKEGITLFNSMPLKNEVSWTTMVTGLAKVGSLHEARCFFDQMPLKDIPAWNAMITVYVDKGLVVEARKLFDLMQEKNVVSWNCLINGYIGIHQKKEAWRLFLSMFGSTVKQNETSLTSILLACESTTEVMQIHALAKSLGYHADVSFTNALVTAYSRFGDLCAAQLAFEELDAKDVVSWTSMILGYSNHGCSDHALEVFARMLKNGVEPDEITFVGILSACSHSGLINKGRLIFDSMSRGYGIDPKAEHYTCLVDLLGRAGLIEEAKKVLHYMSDNKLDKAALGAVLGACCIHKEVELASQVGRELLKLEPFSAGNYVLLANAYASSGEWNEAAHMRKLMKENRVRKIPGFSQIVVRMRNHVFRAGDKLHPQVGEIYEMLEERLLPQMRKMVHKQGDSSVILYEEL